MEAVQDIPPIQKIESSKLLGYEYGIGVYDHLRYPSTPLQELPFPTLKLLQWLLCSREQLELVLDPAKELSGLLMAKFSPWTSASNFGFSKAVLPDYVLRVKRGKEDEQLDKFTEIRLSSGGFFAFHGTAAENLYSILRCGLLNMSRTHMQRNGAIFGDGIYFSMDPNVALGFSSAGKGWNLSRFGDRPNYIVLCEIANGDGVLCSDGSKPKSQRAASFTKEHHPYEKSSTESSNTTTPNTYIIVQNVDLVKIRYIFVYCNKSDCKSSRTDLSLNVQCTKLGLSLHQRWMIFFRSNAFWLAILSYIILLLGIGCMNSGMLKHRGRPIYSKKS